MRINQIQQLKPSVFYKLTLLAVGLIYADIFYVYRK